MYNICRHQKPRGHLGRLDKNLDIPENAASQEEHPGQVRGLRIQTCSTGLSQWCSEAPGRGHRHCTDHMHSCVGNYLKAHTCAHVHILSRCHDKQYPAKVFFLVLE